jgi:hypothetical protein
MTTSLVAQRLHLPHRRQLLAIVLLASLVGLLVTVSNSVVLQLLAIAALADMLMAVAFARAKVALNPGWPIIAWLYLLGPIGAAAETLGLTLPVGLIVLLGIAPFPIIAVVARPRILSGLFHLLPIAFLALLAALSLAWSSAPAYGGSKLVLWLTTCILPAAAIVVLARATPVSWRLIAGAGVAYALVLILLGEDTSTYPGRVTIFGANPIWIGRAAAILAIVGLFGPFRLLVRLVLATIGVVAAVLTASGGPLVGLVTGVVAGGAVLVRSRGRIDWRSLLAWLGLGGVAAGLLVATMLGLLDPAFEEAVRDPNNTSRPLFLFEAARLFAASPVIGSGFGAFASTGFDLYPHNMVAEVAAELGILGLLALGAWLVLATRASMRSAIFSALLFSTFVFSLFSGNIAGEAEFWFFSALAVGALPLMPVRGESTPVATSRGAARATQPVTSPAQGQQVLARPAPVEPKPIKQATQGGAVEPATPVRRARRRGACGS